MSNITNNLNRMQTMLAEKARRLTNLQNEVNYAEKRLNVFKEKKSMDVNWISLQGPEYEIPQTIPSRKKVKETRMVKTRDRHSTGTAGMPRALVDAILDFAEANARSLLEQAVKERDDFLCSLSLDPLFSQLLDTDSSDTSEGYPD